MSSRADLFSCCNDSINCSLSCRTAFTFSNMQLSRCSSSFTFVSMNLHLKAWRRVKQRCVILFWNSSAMRVHTQHFRSYTTILCLHDNTGVVQSFWLRISRGESLENFLPTPVCTIEKAFLRLFSFRNNWHVFLKWEEWIISWLTHISCLGTIWNCIVSAGVASNPEKNNKLLFKFSVPDNFSRYLSTVRQGNHQISRLLPFNE